MAQLAGWACGWEPSIALCLVAPGIALVSQQRKHTVESAVYKIGLPLVTAI